MKRSFLRAGRLRRSAVSFAPGAGALSAARRQLYRSLSPVWRGTKAGLKRALRSVLRPHRRDAVLLGRIARDARFAAALGAAAFAYAAGEAHASPPIDLSDIAAGAGGFAVNGTGLYDFAGVSVCRAGDVNGDGIADVVIGANNADALGIPYAGQVYVVFGKAGGAAVSVSDLVLGNGGFVIYGVDDTDLAGGSVAAAGDVNGDGLADVVIGVPYGDPGGRADAGEAFVVFGKADGAAVELSDVAAGMDGFAINGIDPDDSAGIAVGGGGDINGDGLSDVIVGAFFADPGGESRAGESYVVFGKAGGTAVELSAVAAGTGGFAINGIEEDDFSGGNVGHAGDVNGDGLADVIISAEGANLDAGEAYVIFGKKTGAAVSLASVAAGSGGGFVMFGIDADDSAGSSVGGAGDVNGDGMGDVIVGASRAYGGGLSGAGEAYVVFGKTSATPVNLSTVAAGAGGFLINGEAANDNAGAGVGGAGDVNGDGLADLIVGAPYAKGPLGELGVGAAYVVYGKADGAVVNLSAVAAGTGGFRMNGIGEGDLAGYSTAGAGDVNGDGVADVIVGAFYADPGGVAHAGQSYVVFNPEAPAASGTYRAKSFPGDGPGGAIVPAVALEDARAKINFSDEDAGSSAGAASAETVTLTRNDAAIANLASPELVPDVHWQVSTNRAGWASAELTFHYTDAEIAGLVEATLLLYSAAAPTGPWTELATTIDAARNEAKATVSSFSHFALVGQTPTPTPTPTPPPASVKKWVTYE